MTITDTAAASALSLRSLRKTFGAATAVDCLDLTVRAGEFFALLGPNGAGKTIDIFGVDARRRPIDAKRITAWLPDEPMLYDKLDPLEYLEFVAGLWGVDPAEAQSRAGDLLRTLDLWKHRNERCEGFSRGMKQKVALAGALIHDPMLLMLDEPLTGLDAAAARQVKDLLVERTRAGRSIILTTHILEVAERLADRIGIIHRGKLIAQGTMEELRAAAGGAHSSLEDVFLELTRPMEQAA
jgi:ABC-2 type transport system ATP-binding protein